MADTSTLHNSYWRQGSVLPRELLSPGVIPSNLDPLARLILISHDCDIVHSSYELEPYVEFLVARPAAERDGSKSNGKNPRSLQLCLDVNGTEQLYEISIHEKYRDDRNVLERGEPDSAYRLSTSNIQRMGLWAGKRYNRPAFPSAFNQRIPPKLKKKFKRALEQYGDQVSGIFIFLAPNTELSEAETYRIIVRIVAPRAAFENDNDEQTLFKLADEMQRTFASCAGIEVEELKLDSEAAFTLEDWKVSKLWDYEFLSDPEEDHHSYLGGAGP